MTNIPRPTVDQPAPAADYNAPYDRQSALPAGGASPDQNRLIGWLVARMRSAGARIFMADDARAAMHGWQTTQGKLGLSRTYRDPRFDSLAPCNQCHGSGKAEDQSCTRCSGTGRITLAVHTVSRLEQRRVR